MKKYAVVLGGNADIGKYICKRLAENNYTVYCTYRGKKPIFSSTLKGLINIYRVDITKVNSINSFIKKLKDKNIQWDIFFSSVGTTEPIGPYFNTEIEIWNNCFFVNFNAQINVLNQLYKIRNSERVNDVIFMAGGGTNGTFDNYSAYTLAKIALIKFCELMDSENKDMKFIIIGPGFVKTKTHQETINAGMRAGKNYSRVKKFIEEENGTSLEKIFNVIQWIIEQPKEIVGGRNFSVVNDEFNNVELKDKLEKNLDMYKLRRFLNDWNKEK